MDYQRKCVRCAIIFTRARASSGRLSNAICCSKTCSWPTTQENRASEILRQKTVLDSGSGCHIWLGACTNDGYGTIRFRCKPSRTHRVAWELKNGPIPPGLLVLHKCDVPKCVNPDHLFLGTQQENMNDMVRKKRDRPCRGARQPHAKLTDSAVREIRSSSENQYILADRYGVSQGTITRVKTRRGWAHVN